MSFTVADVVLDVREGVSDTLEPYRYSDAFIVRRVNQAVRRACILRPDLFSKHTTITCVAGPLQTCPADSVRLMDVVSTGSGLAVKEINQDALDLMIPTWPTTAGAAAQNWMRYPRDPNRFYVYPPAAGGETLSIVYAQSPATLVLGGTVPMPDAYMPCIIDGTMWLMEAIDAEHVESPRAAAFKASFEAALGATVANRKLTDVESAGMNRDEVV